jgi:hypothetical protein
MKRRGFLQLSASAGMIVLAGLDSSECTEIVVKTPILPPKTPDKDDILLLELADRGIISDETVKKEILTPPKRVVVEVDEYKPQWNIDGNWAKAEDRGELIKHLSGSIHRKDPSHLITLSTDDLQRLHDNSHWSMGSRTFKKVRKRKRRR